MKRSVIFFLLSCVLISGCANESVGMDVISSQNIISDNWYELDIDIIVNEETDSAKDAYSNEIIQHILDNDFYSTHFSFDLSGYPNEIAVDVFTSEKNFKKGEPSYSFKYATKSNTGNVDIQNNIKDNPYEFKILYE